MPFGVEVTYKPSAPKDKERLHTYGRKTLSGIFIGYSQNAGGSWDEDLLLVDWHELEQADRASDVHVKRVKFKGVVPSMLGSRYRFRLQTNELKQPPTCLLYTSPSPRDVEESRMPSSA